MRSLVKTNLNLFIAGFGCCKQEIFACFSPHYDISRFGISCVSAPEDADVLVVQGFYNGLSEKRLLHCYSSMRDPKWVIAAGKCIVDSSVFYSGYNFVQRFSNKLRIDYFIPGCPPRPEAFIYGMLQLIESG
ncbi:MAG: hydrogenase [Actinobacteria bacterium]|nr:hydrogenase [Actinomycetota bacterium]